MPLSQETITAINNLITRLNTQVDASTNILTATTTTTPVVQNDGTTANIPTWTNVRTQVSATATQYLNNLSTGWLPQINVVEDDDRVLLRLVGYYGGQGTAPTDFVNQYFTDTTTSATGFTPNIADATNLRADQTLSDDQLNAISKIPNIESQLAQILGNVQSNWIFHGSTPAHVFNPTAGLQAEAVGVGIGASGAVYVGTRNAYVDDTILRHTSGTVFTNVTAFGAGLSENGTLHFLLAEGRKIYSYSRGASLDNNNESVSWNNEVGETTQSVDINGDQVVALTTNSGGTRRLRDGVFDNAGNIMFNVPSPGRLTNISAISAIPAAERPKLVGVAIVDENTLAFLVENLDGGNNTRILRIYMITRTLTGYVRAQTDGVDIPTIDLIYSHWDEHIGDLAFRDTENFYISQPHFISYYKDANTVKIDGGRLKDSSVAYASFTQGTKDRFLSDDDLRTVRSLANIHDGFLLAEANPLSDLLPGLSGKTFADSSVWNNRHLTITPDRIIPGFNSNNAQFAGVAALAGQSALSIVETGRGVGIITVNSAHSEYHYLQVGSTGTGSRNVAIPTPYTFPTNSGTTKTAADNERYIVVNQPSAGGIPSATSYNYRGTQTTAQVVANDPHFAESTQTSNRIFSQNLTKSAAHDWGNLVNAYIFEARLYLIFYVAPSAAAAFYLHRAYQLTAPFSRDDDRELTTPLNDANIVSIIQNAHSKWITFTDGVVKRVRRGNYFRVMASADYDALLNTEKQDSETVFGTY